MRVGTAGRREWHRLWPGLLPVALLLAYHGVNQELSVFYLLPPEAAWPALAPGDLRTADGAAFAADVHGRFLYGTLSALVRLAAAATIAMALMALWPRWRWWAVLAAVAAASGLGLLAAFWLAEDDPHLRHLAFAPLEAAEAAGVVGPGTAGRLRTTLIVNTALGGIAIVLFIAAASALAVRARPGDDLAVAALRRRVRHVRALCLSAAALLVLILLGQEAVAAWPRGLLRPEAADAYARLADGYTLHAGVSATVLMAGVCLPAILSLDCDIDRAARSAAGEEPADRRGWLQRHQLEIARASATTAVVATAAPILTSPIADLAGTLVGG